MERLSLATALLLLSVSMTMAEESAWAPSYPKPGKKSGEIRVLGKAIPVAGWSLAKFAEAKVWPVGGGEATHHLVPVDPVTGVWNGTIRKLNPTREYNVVVIIPIEKEGESACLLASDPKRSERDNPPSLLILQPMEFVKFSC